MRFSAHTSPPVPWKNGGGVTRELAVRRQGDHVLWRLSLAEIDRDGPFSRFPGLARIHTIISGAGLDLTGPGGVLAARPLQPLAFSGDLALTARRLDGPCRAFNVIYDPALYSATARVVTGNTPYQAAAGAAVFVVAGPCDCDGIGALHAGEGVVPDRAALLTPAQDATLIVVEFAQPASSNPATAAR